MRDVLRRHVDQLPAGCDLILHPRREVLTIEFTKLEAEIVRILQQANAEKARANPNQSCHAPAGRARTMTRILLALLAFYRRWLSPALHALGPRRMPFCAHLLGVRSRRDRNAWASARRRAGHLAAAALPSVQPRRTRSSAAR